MENTTFTLKIIGIIISHLTKKSKKKAAQSTEATLQDLSSVPSGFETGNEAPYATVDKSS